MRCIFNIVREKKSRMIYLIYEKNILILNMHFKPGKFQISTTTDEESLGHQPVLNTNVY